MWGIVLLDAPALGPLCLACCLQMVGIGTSDVDLDKYHHTFCSLLGRDEESWGLSYTGMWGPYGQAGWEEPPCLRANPYPAVPQGFSTTRAIRRASPQGLARVPSLACTWTPGMGH